MKEGNCQSITNKCKTIPNYPRPRSYHTAITYKTYTKAESNEMCPGKFCGPDCQTESDECQSTSKYPNYPIPKPGETLFNFVGPSDENCPNNCCDKTNEYCYRHIDNAGNQVDPDEEIMLVFGGLLTINVTFDTVENATDILSSCEIPDEIKDSKDDELLQKYLVNNCGYEILNELWAYNINKNNWSFVKPYVDTKLTTQQKPHPRYGHAVVYVEQTETTTFGQVIYRKFMYMYGGYSLYCQHSCEDMWKYEISYAPQRYYLDTSYADPSSSGNSIWDRGNVWSRIYPSNVIGPGPRVHHCMTVDDSFKYIYLFGGMGVDGKSNKNILYNDLWRYEIKTNTWEQINPNGIVKISRTVMYWNGSTAKIEVSFEDYEPGTDIIEMILQLNDPLKRGHFPDARSSGALTYSYFNKKEYLVLFGGYKWKDEKIYNFQIQLGDLWVYSITGNSWTQAYPNSDNNPAERYGFGFIAIDNVKMLLYGGMNSEKVFNDLWLFNTNTNMWIKIDRMNLVENEKDWPLPAKYFSLTSYSGGVVIYGGSVWINSDLNEYQTPILQGEKQYFAIVDNLWILSSNNCAEDCSGNGKCDYGRCICERNYWGSHCQYKYCPGSFCYTDIDIFTSQVCNHCSGNGDCEDGTCICYKGYVGDDCSIEDCDNDCSGSENGKCMLMKPKSQCLCNEKLKRGGDDCSKIFCLNVCGTTGECDEDTGICQCQTGFFGEDCSIFMIDFRESAELFKLSKFYIYILLIFYGII